jgi:hypothetical protein
MAQALAFRVHVGLMHGDLTAGVGEKDTDLSLGMIGWKTGIVSHHFNIRVSILI